MLSLGVFGPLFHSLGAVSQFSVSLRLPQEPYL